jgi:hypothetical protein
MIRSYRRSLVFSALVALIPIAAFCGSKMQVHVNKRPVDMAKMQSVILADEVFVPARQFAESTGATVIYNPTTQTLTVQSSKGTGVLRLGSHTGRIKGTRVFFPTAPYFSGGQFYAPMLFFSEMFDQAWYWDPFYQQFRWVPIFPRWGGYRPPMIIPGPGGSSQSGPTSEHQPQPPASGSSLVRPLPSGTSPKVVVQVGAKSTTYPVSKEAVILRGKIGAQASEVSLSSIRPGDKLTIQRDSQGRITVIRATYKQVAGRITSITGNVVTLDTGDVLKLCSQTSIYLPDNSTGTLADLMVGDAVTASMNPDTGLACVIQVQPRFPAGTSNTDNDENPIAVNSWGPLNVGDVLTVRFRASAGGQAWFTIPGVQANAKMLETAPGLYQAYYIIQPGDTALRQPIKVMFKAANGSVITVLSRRPIMIRSLVDTRPRITSPHQGQQITSPVVVTGSAQPGSLIRVVIEFRRNAQGFFPLQGVTAVQDVQVDTDGHWQTPPLAAVAPYSDSDDLPPLDMGVFTDIYTWRDRERPTVWTITAVSVGPNGEEKAAYTIDVTKSKSQNIGGLAPLLVELKT